MEFAKSNAGDSLSLWNGIWLRFRAIVLRGAEGRKITSEIQFERLPRVLPKTFVTLTTGEDARRNTKLRQSPSVSGSSAV